MTKLFLRDIGSHPERDLEVTLFPDGELQFEADNGKYTHINISKEGVKELVEFLNNSIASNESTVQDVCPRCEGMGKYQRLGLPHKECAVCNGTGKFRNEP